ncbi:MAG: DUF2232 domain-containing protein [Eubacteriaceae bacterium]|jgi:hypothetical protein|nr:DUF2232 domain-containing protein [Eubacteriaceae bacterium]
MKTKGVAEGGIVSGLVVVIALISIYFPFSMTLTLLLTLFLPVPIVVLGRRHNLMTSVISGVTAMLIMFLFVNPISALSLGVYFCAIGNTLVYGLSKGWNTARRIITVGLVLVFIIFAGIGLFEIITGQRYIEMIASEAKVAMDAVLETYQKLGVFDAEQENLMGEAAQVFIKTIPMTIPAMLLILPFVMSWWINLLTGFTFKRLRMPIAPVLPLSYWKADMPQKVFVVVLFVVGWLPIGEVYKMTFNLIMYTIYGVMGLSFIYHLIETKTKKPSMLLKVLTVVATVLFQPVTLLLTMVGMFDFFIDLKGRITK